MFWIEEKCYKVRYRDGIWQNGISKTIQPMDITVCWDVT